MSESPGRESKFALVGEELRVRIRARSQMPASAA